MADLGTIGVGATSNASNTAETGASPLEVIGSANDSNYVYDTANSTHEGTIDVAIGTIPSDFVTMTTLYVNLRYFWQTGTQVNTWATLSAEIFQSDASTSMSDKVTIASSITTTTPTNSGATQLTNVDTTSDKSVWDGAVLRIYFNITRVKGGDSIAECVSAAELTGTYSTEVALTADDLESASELTKPALVCIYAATADDLESASEVSSPAAVHLLDDGILLEGDMQAGTDILLLSGDMSDVATDLLLLQSGQRDAPAGASTGISKIAGGGGLVGFKRGLAA